MHAAAAEEEVVRLSQAAGHGRFARRWGCSPPANEMRLLQPKVFEGPFHFIAREAHLLLCQRR